MVKKWHTFSQMGHLSTQPIIKEGHQNPQDTLFLHNQQSRGHLSTQSTINKASEPEITTLNSPYTPFESPNLNKNEEMLKTKSIVWTIELTSTPNQSQTNHDDLEQEEGGARRRPTTRKLAGENRRRLGRDGDGFCSGFVGLGAQLNVKAHHITVKAHFGSIKF